MLRNVTVFLIFELFCCFFNVEPSPDGTPLCMKKLSNFINPIYNAFSEGTIF